MNDHTSSNIRVTSFEAKEYIEGTIVPEGFNRSKAAIVDGKRTGRDHYIFREIKDGVKRHFIFCVDYDGYVNSLEIREQDV